MKEHEFNRYLEFNRSPTYTHGDPEARFAGGIRVVKLPQHSGLLARQARNLAAQLLLCADEVDRRGFEDRPPGRFPDE